ncbi:MAG: hypothetical protein ACR2NU_09915, partial [Aeoliella sp.]
MHSAKSVTTICLLAMLPLGGLVGCYQGNAHEHRSSGGSAQEFSGEYPVKVVCTTGQVAEMISRIGGEHLHVD